MNTINKAAEVVCRPADRTILVYGFSDRECGEIQKPVLVNGCRLIQVFCVEDVLALPADFVLLDNAGIFQCEQEILNSYHREVLDEIHEQVFWIGDGTSREKRSTTSRK